MSIKKSLVFLLISFVLQCETRVLFKREKNTSETNSTNEIFEHVTSSAVLKSEHSDFKNEVSEEIVDGKDRLKKLWNEIDMLHRRNRRGFFNSHSRYKPKGPIYIDSDEYEFSPPLGEHSENKQTYFYPPPESHEDESKEEKESVEEIHEGPYPPSSHDRPYPSLTYGPPESAASHEETHPHPLHEDLHPPSSGDESHPPPSHDHPHEGYVIYPPEKDGPEDSKVEPHYEPYPPHSDLVPPKESTKDSGHDLKTDLKPNHELLIIAEKHISKIKEMEKKQEHEGPPSTSYGEPYSSIKEMEKKHEHEGPPSTSYGEPYSSISDPSPHIEPPKPVATVKGPPATSYGVPDAKIEVSEIKFSKENVSLVSSKKIKDLNEAKPYDLSSSSYGAPLKSVTNDIKTESTKNKPFFALPDVTKDSKFNLRNKKEINTDTNKFKKERAYVMIPMEKYQELEVCMQKSFSSAYTIKLDGSLVRE